MEKNNNILVEILIRGRNSAKRLQNLLCGKVNNDESVSINDLLMEVSESFASGLSMLGSFGSIYKESEVFTGNVEKTPLPLVKQRRGQYPRRRSKDTIVKVSDTSEDGYQWRKYGQKVILNSKFPRCYYRCTDKVSHGCMATKHVQQLENESNKFHITYFDRHTCPTPPNHIVLHHGPGRFLDFQGFKNQQDLTINSSTNKKTRINPSLKRKDSSSKGSSTNVDASLSPALVLEDISVEDIYPCYEAPGSDYGGSSSSISQGFLGMDFFEHGDYISEILADDVFDGRILESFWGSSN